MKQHAQTLVLLIGAVILLAIVVSWLHPAGAPQAPDTPGTPADTNAMFAITCSAILITPLLAGLIRGQRLRIRRDLRSLELATADLTWTARNGREYAILRDAERVRVVAA